MIIKVKGHQHRWLAGDYDLEIGHFQRWIAWWLVNWWIVAFLFCEHFLGICLPRPLRCYDKICTATYLQGLRWWSCTGSAILILWSEFFYLNDDGTADDQEDIPVELPRSKSYVILKSPYSHIVLINLSYTVKIYRFPIADKFVSGLLAFIGAI